MDEGLRELLLQFVSLIEVLKSTAPQAWELMVRQQRVYVFQGSVWAVVLAMGTVALGVLGCKVWRHAKQADGSIDGAIVLWIGMIGVGVGAIGCVVGAVSRSMNPGYYALQELLRHLR